MLKNTFLLYLKQFLFYLRYSRSKYIHFGFQPAFPLKCPMICRAKCPMWNCKYHYDNFDWSSALYTQYCNIQGLTKQ